MGGLAMIGGKSPVAKAAAGVDQAAEVLARWQGEPAAKTAELDDLEARAGAEALDDENAAGRLSAQISQLRAGVDVAGRAVQTAGERLVQARRDVVLARAGELRAEASRLRDEADQRQAKTDKLLAELSAWEGGAKYVPWEPDRDAVISRGPVEYKIPLTQAMRNRAAALDKEAARLEQQAGAGADAVEHTAARVMTSAAG
jgi:hypothetical protein